MDRHIALELLGLNPDATPAAIDARYKQVMDFLSPDGGDPPALHNVLLQSRSMLSVAHSALLKPETGPGQSNKQQSGAHGTAHASGVAKPSTDSVDASKESPLAPILSEQWWQMYRRPVLIALAALAVVLCIVPEVPAPPPPPPLQTIQPQPGPATSTGTDATTKPQALSPDSSPAGPLPPQTLSNILPPAVTRPQPENNLTPMPNPSPLIIDPLQDPEKFLWIFLYDLSTGKDVSSMIQQPAALTLMIGSSFKHTCPEYRNLPPDAITLFSRSPGKATLRVNESYFAGRDITRDYYLISDNGSWKVADVLPASPAPESDQSTDEISRILRR